MKTLKIAALALFTALSFAACDGDGTGITGLNRGQFEGDISGVLDIGIAGDAESSYYVTPGFHDLIVLTDFQRGVRIYIYESEDEFFEGRWSIDSEDESNYRIVAWVEDLETGESFSSVNGTLDLEDVRDAGIEGSATFTAESDDRFGDYINVDVVFNTDYTSDVDLNRGASFSRAEKR